MEKALFLAVSIEVHKKKQHESVLQSYAED